MVKCGETRCIDKCPGSMVRCFGDGKGTDRTRTAHVGFGAGPRPPNAAVGVRFWNRRRGRAGPAVRHPASHRRRLGAHALMRPGLRKLALTAHVVFSVGWLGAVAGFVDLAIVGLSNRDAQMVRAAYIGMNLIGWFVIVPLCVVSLLTGLIQSLGTTWGLFRHYWVVAKVVITVPSTLLLLLHMQPIGRLALVAAETTLSGADLRGMRIEVVVQACAALLALLVATLLSVYKPRGMTRVGWRDQYEERLSARE